MQKTILREAGNALKLLDGAGLSYNAATFFSAGYDSPFRLLNRHNEVWIPAA